MVKFLVLSSLLLSTLAFGDNSDSASTSSNSFVPYSQYSLGGIGLINTPTARFSDDGEFEMGVSAGYTIQSDVCQSPAFSLDGSSSKIHQR